MTFPTNGRLLPIATVSHYTEKLCKLQHTLYKYIIIHVYIHVHVHVKYYIHVTIVANPIFCMLAYSHYPTCNVFSTAQWFWPVSQTLHLWTRELYCGLKTKLLLPRQICTCTCTKLFAACTYVYIH